MAKLKDYLSLVVFAHTIFAMPFALIGFFIAIRYSGYPFDWITLLLCIACMVLARNTAMGFNRWADQKIDAKNPRTASREIPSGVIKSKSALTFTIYNALLFIVAAGLINPLCLKLSPLALLIIMGYSYTKRYTWLCHLVLGLGLSCAPIGAYIAVAGHFHWLPLMFSGIVLTWVSGFDVLYSLQDVEFDQLNGCHSIPSRIGIRNSLIVSILLHTLTFALVVIAGLLAKIGPMYWVGCVIFTGLLIYQHLIVKPNDLTRVNRAFGTTNGVASLLFAIMVIIGLYI